MSSQKQTSIPIRHKHLTKIQTKFLTSSHFLNITIISIFIYISAIYVHITYQSFFLVLSPYPTCFFNIFLIAVPTISHSWHHTNYTTEPPTANTIFPTLSHYEHPQVLPVNQSNIFVLSIIISTIFSHYFIINTHKYCQRPWWHFMTLLFYFIIILLFFIVFIFYSLFI